MRATLRFSLARTVGVAVVDVVDLEALDGGRVEGRWRATSSWMGSAARSSVRIPERAPRFLPKTVRTASMR